MPSKIRLQRISERIQNELAEMLINEVQDPRLVGISVTDVKIDREMAYDDIYVSAVEGQERSREVLEGLHFSSGFIRHTLSTKVYLRTFPRLRFHWDPTPERADHIERVLASLRTEEGPNGEGSNPATAQTPEEDLDAAESEEQKDGE
ncbi:MAG: 30S ribosome-binding factor RbfA [Chloroflexi bacterium]|nr:MAG: 30S ribosome-binding factor RbfA [Chloroflexota bacterium]